MKTQHHTCEIRICADDFRGDHAGMKCASAICDVIAKAEGTIKANGCQLVKYKLDNTPTMDLNPRGDIVTITFYVRSPFLADQMKLEVDFIKGDNDCSQPTEGATTVNLDFKL